MPSRRLTYPFSAIVGQERLKLALILNAVNPKIGGLLIFGTKGVGKSLAVRAFEEILPEVESVEGCPFNCDPRDSLEMCQSCLSRLQIDGYLPQKKRDVRIIQLPISATEDRLIGTLNVETALKEGRKVLQPGLLAEANQNILYIDEVNLLPDYLVNCFLDPAASGWNIVQREAVAYTHPSRFIMIASMNPEEGELRPQILDRFALSVNVESVKDLELRMEIVRRNEFFEEDPSGFCEKFEKMQEELKERIRLARERLPKVTISEKMFECVARICSELEIDGCRSDIAAIKAAKALAAFKGKTVVEPDDILEVSEFALSHRKRRGGQEASADTRGVIDRLREQLSHVNEVPSRPMVGEQTEEDVLGLLQLATATRRHRRIRRESRVLRALNPLILFSLFFTLYYMTFTVAMFFYNHVFTGIPIESLSITTTLDQLWPYLILMSLITLIMLQVMSYFHLGSKRRASSVYFYEASGGKLVRRIVDQIRTPSASASNLWGSSGERKEAAPSPDKILNIPLYASISRLYKIILSRGPKIAESLKQLREGGKEYKFSLTQRTSRRRGSLVGKRVKTISSSLQGRYVSYKFPTQKPWNIALAPTIRAAASFQSRRGHEKLLITIKPQDIRVKMRESRTPLTILLLLDMSESMATSLDNIRNAVLSMHDIAYKKRDRVALVVFKGSGATVLQPPTTNLNLLEKKLLEVGTSDFTPLATGMFQAWRVLRNEKMRNKDIIPTLIIISDGITNIPLERPLSPYTRGRFINPAQADVIDAAGLLQREGIRTIIINTAHEAKSNENLSKYTAPIVSSTGRQWIDPTSLMMEIPRITGGYYYGIGEGGEVESKILMDAFTIIDREPPHP